MRRPLAGLFAVAALLGFAACKAFNPYECPSYYRSASYVGRLGAMPPDSDGESRGRVAFSLDEIKGPEPQQGFHAWVNFFGFLPAVSEGHIHEGTPANPGRILWKSSFAFPRDSIWSSNDVFAGPGPWRDLWDRLSEGQAYFEIHAPSGESVSATLRKMDTIPWVKACT